MMNTFTIITGLITFIGICSSNSRNVSEYRRYYTSATFFMLGLTVGFGLSSVTGTAIHLPDTITAKNLFGFALFGGTGLLIFLCFSASLFIPEKERRSELSKIGSAVSGFFLFILIFFPLHFFPGPPKKFLTFGEQMTLIQRSLDRSDYDRALLLLKDKKKYLDKSDTRVPKLDEMILDIHELQMNFKGNPIESSSIDNSDSDPPTGPNKALQPTAAGDG